MSTLTKKVAKEILQRLDELEGVYTCDAMHELFNHDYYITGTKEAKKFLKQNIDELFEALEQYQFDFGEPYPYITDPERLATLVVLYTAENIWCQLSTVNKYWDDRLTNEILQEIKKELRQFINQQ